MSFSKNVLNLFPIKKTLRNLYQLAKISLSQRIMSCSPDVPVANTENALQSEASNFKYYSMAIDESTCQRHCPVSYLFYGESIKILISLKNGCLSPTYRHHKSQWFIGQRNATLNRPGLNLTNVSMVTPGGVAAVVGRVKGLIRLIVEEATKFGNNSVVQYRCLIRQRKICAKFWKMKA